ncbi:MAG: transcription termination factor NusA, partial [Chloroflexota bacterium]
MKNEFELAFNEIKNQRALPQETVIEALRTALISAYRRYSGASAAQMVDATIDPATGRTRILVEKEVVDEVISPLTEVSLEKARFYEPEAQLFDTVMVQVEGTTRQFGRIAAQTAKQVILQKIREAERNTLYEEFVDREGDIITGTVQNVNSSVVTVSLGRAEAVMPRSHQIPGERHRQHDKVRVYVVEVKKTNKGPQIIVSRSHRNMLKRLLEFEVPEIYNGQIEIKSIAREAGYRSKVAVFALQEGIDPVGACVGMRGMRIQNIVRELHEEKIDVIEWQSDQKQFISRALSPARVTGVYLEDDLETGKTAVVIVPDDQLSLAIGREGQNARLAAKLTGWRIDIKSVTEAVSDVIRDLDKPLFAKLYAQHADLVDEAQRIMAKRDDNRTVMPEEYTALNELANLAEKALSEQRDKEREERLAEIEAVKATVPPTLFEIPIDQLDASPHILAKLETLENVGEVMWRFLIDEKHISNMLRGLPISAFESVKEALDDIMMAAMTGELDIEAVAEDAPVTEAVEEAAPEAVAEPEPAANVEAPEPTVAEPIAEAPAATAEPAEEADETPVPEPIATVAGEELPAAFPMELPDVEEVAMPTPPKPAREPEPESEPEPTFDELDFDDADDFDDDEEGRGKKKGKKKRRQLVFDEDSGRVVSKRKRKGNRSRDNWED